MVDAGTDMAHEQHNVYPGMKAIIVDGDRFLVVKQLVGDYAFWDLPGGRIHHGENPLEILFRQVKEETGLEITIIKPAGVWWLYRVFDPDQMVYMTYLCKAKNPQAIDLSKNPDRSENIEEYRWITKEEFLSGDCPPADESLRELIDRAL